MKRVEIRNIQDISFYKDEGNNCLNCVVEYNDILFTSLTTYHVDLYFDQFDSVDSGLYYLNKDVRLKDLPRHLLKKDAEDFLDQIYKYYPELFNNYQKA
jgi:hypothetical protein